jgi:hypothetical protein
VGLLYFWFAIICCVVVCFFDLKSIAYMFFLLLLFCGGVGVLLRCFVFLQRALYISASNQPIKRR